MDYTNNNYLTLKLDQKYYENDLILNNINIKFNDSGIYILKGKNGSGKTTLLNILSGLDLNFHGELIYLNEVINQKNIDFYNSKISYFTQQNIIFDGLSVIDNLLLPFENKDIEKAKSLLKKVQLEGFEKKTVDTLSLGEKQRLCFCRILYSEKSIILLDESTENLDIENKTIILKALDLLKKDHLIIFATHDDFVINYFKSKHIITIENKSISSLNDDNRSFTNINKEHKLSHSKIKIHKPYFIFTIIFSFVFTFLFLVFSSFYTSMNKEDISKKTYEIYLNTSDAYILNDNVDLSNNKYEKNTVFNIVNENKIEVNLEKNENIASILTNSNLNFLNVLEGRLPENENEIIVSNYSFPNYSDNKIIEKTLQDITSSSNINKNYKIVGIYKGQINTYYQEKAKLNLNTHNYYEISYTFNYLSAFTLNDNSSNYGQILRKTSDNLKIINQRDIYDFSDFIRNKSNLFPCVPFFLDEKGNYPYTFFDYTFGNLLFSIFSVVLLIIYMVVIVINYLINFKKHYLLLRAIGVRREKIEKTAIFDLIIPCVIGMVVASIFSTISLLLINIMYNNIVKANINLLMLVNYFYLISLAILLAYICITIYIIKYKLSNKDLSKLISEIKIK